MGDLNALSGIFTVWVSEFIFVLEAAPLLIRLGRVLTPDGISALMCSPSVTVS